MSEKIEDGGPVFPFIVRTPGGSIDPVSGEKVPLGQENHRIFTGMSLRDYFAGQALTNPAICTGTANTRDLERWFGDRVGIERSKIVAAQAREYADAMLKERGRG